MQDGMLVGRHRDAERARERLIALLPFVWGMSPSNSADGFDVLARIFANPAIEPPSAARRVCAHPAVRPGFTRRCRERDDAVGATGRSERLAACAVRRVDAG